MRLTTVPNEGEAEILCRMLRVEGIRCGHRMTDQFLWDDSGRAFDGWREILVAEPDLARAREILSTTDSLYYRLARAQRRPLG